VRNRIGLQADAKQVIGRRDWVRLTQASADGEYGALSKARLCSQEPDLHVSYFRKLEPGEYRPGRTGWNL